MNRYYFSTLFFTLLFLFFTNHSFAQCLSPEDKARFMKEKIAFIEKKKSSKDDDASTRSSSSNCEDDNNLLTTSYDVSAIITVLIPEGGNASDGWNQSNIGQIQSDIQAAFETTYDITINFATTRILESDATHLDQTTMDNVCDHLNIYLKKGLGGNHAIMPPAFSVMMFEEDGLYTNDPYGKSSFIHEIGHAFGLYHTHELTSPKELVTRCDTGICPCNCKTKGDMVCDTPADPYLSIHDTNNSTSPNCTILYTANNKDDCGGVAGQGMQYVDHDLPKNYMSYYNWSGCSRSEFTEGQEQAMKETLEMYGHMLLGSPTPEDYEKGFVAGTSVVTWSQDMYLKENTVINGNLTMDGINVYMMDPVLATDPPSEITVNGSLTIKNSKIRMGATCGNPSNSFWKGITVNGKITIEGESEIYDAETVITSENNSTPDPVSIKDSKFENNQKILFLSNTPMEGWIDNSSFIGGKVDDSIFEAINSHDLCFKNCQITGIAQNCSAINAVNTSVVYLKEGDDKESSITLWKSFMTPAIEATNHYQVKVIGTEIEASQPFMVSGFINFICRDNSIKNLNTIPLPDSESKIVSIENVDISKNNFLQEGAYSAIKIEGTSPLNNIVENNKVVGGKHGFTTMGNQGSGMSDEVSGIQFCCNEFETTTIHDFNWLNRVAPLQGTTMATGNVFSNASTYDISSGTDVITTYLYLNNASEQTPEVNPNSTLIIKSDTDQENINCDPGSDFYSLTGGGGTDHALMSYHELVTDSIAGEDSTVLHVLHEILDSIGTELTSILDGGNTSVIIDIIETNSETDPESVLTVLENYTPNLSSDVIVKFLDNSKYFTESEVTQVLSNNKHVISNDHISKILSCDNFSPSSKQQIMNAGIGNQKIQELKGKMFNYNGYKDAVIRRSIEKEWDEASPNMAKLKYWISKMRSPNTKYILGRHIYNEESPQAYSDYWNRLKNLSREETEKFEDLEFLSMFQNLEFDKIKNSQILKLKSIADKQPGIITTWAQNICRHKNLCDFSLNEYFYPCKYIYFKTKDSPLAHSRAESKTEQISIYPNPNLGSFELIVNEDFIGGEYSIYNSTGLLITSDRINKNKMRLNISDEFKGVFFLKATNSGKLIETKKLVIL